MNLTDKYNMLVREFSKRERRGFSAKDFGMEYEEFLAIVKQIESDGLFEKGAWYLGGDYGFNGLTFKGRCFLEDNDKKEYCKSEKSAEIKKSNIQENEMKCNQNKVFIVHGHDNETKQEIARFIESIGLEAIILHEQASRSMTIIEKIEYYSNEANFAVVLYTPCDKGRGAKETNIPAKDRARQNVVFEHGYLMAKIGRGNVCALVKGEIETPSDISGVVYTPLDSNGGWKIELTKELKACGYAIAK